ncbi:MAG: GGDEF domain-containing protein [Alphaproteobacteria bacterium]|nr:GGDEF domain-containing protein [Alphaproteobacteria bacterium]
MLTIGGVGVNGLVAFGKAAVARLFGDLTADLLIGLLLPSSHSLLVRQRRAGLIVSRVRLIAMTFAILTPLWIAIDAIAFTGPVCIWLASLRGVATLAFIAVALGFHDTDEVGSAHRALLVLQIIPTAFFTASLRVLYLYPTEGTAGMVAAGYAFLPFVMVVGLSVFPITLVEGILFSGPMMLAVSLGAVVGYPILPFNSYFGALWLLLLLGVAATLAGMSQLHFMTALVNQAARDLLTRAYTRRVGEELMEMLYVAVARADGPIAVAFIDLDNFKSINDLFGHEEGDRALRMAAESLRLMLRRNDVLVRWGGEEFLVIMPFTDCEGAYKAVQRLRSTGLGTRPDGLVQTASIGVAERLADSCEGWSALVERADRRMYTAKERGKDQAILCGDITVLFESQPKAATAAVSKAKMGHGAKMATSVHDSDLAS